MKISTTPTTGTSFLHTYAFEITLFILSIILTVTSLNYPFYWDNVAQLSVPANWYYDTNFTHFYVPDHMATGHPTFIGMYFAALWKIFGKSLVVSHLAMLPFVFGLACQIYKLCTNLKITKQHGVIITCFILSDATLLSQMSLITFEVIHLFFYLLCINSILKDNKTTLAIAFTCLVLVSLRATICGGGVMLFHFLYHYSKTKKIAIKPFLPYIFGITAIVLFLLFFYLNKGWIVHNTVSNTWKESAEYASFTEILRNTGLFIWRLIDFGRVFIFIVFGFFLLSIVKSKHIFPKSAQPLLLLILSQFIVFFPIIVIYKNPFGHRYLLPVIIPVIILTVLWVLHFKKWKRTVLTLSYICLISGHFWLYPPKISQGWDATTLHWNYYTVRSEMIDFIQLNQFNPQTTGSFFPNAKSFKLIDLSSEDIGFKHAEIEKDDYILFSNAFNVSDEIIDTLQDQNTWSPVKTFERNRIYMTLYKRNHEN
ncbi:hypothetical protein [Pseudotamlana agarivorans]|uniref:hypothetical protein n=1 Tax=Pseudotamlana agarivorans TaxID=481183 RepID=UPI0008299616|nr:hypothetical protein [Tamlana agarivorans]